MIDTSTVFRIVFKRNCNEEVGVVAKITSGDYTRCIRRDGTHVGSSHSVPENANGYLCGHKFFSDLTIDESLAIAQTNVEADPEFPSPYDGKLYPKHRGYLLWPIMREKALYRSGAGNYLCFFSIQG